MKLSPAFSKLLVLDCFVCKVSATGSNKINGDITVTTNLVQTDF